jgi:hypothetical protein
MVLSRFVVGIYVCDIYAGDRCFAQLVFPPSPPRLVSRTDAPIFSPPPALLSTRSYNVLLFLKTHQFLLDYTFDHAESDSVVRIRLSLLPRSVYSIERMSVLFCLLLICTGLGTYDEFISI